MPVDNLEAAQVGVEYFGQLDPPLQNPVVVSPDAGGVYRAKNSVKRCINVLEQNPEWLDNKTKKKAGEIARMDLVGSVEGCDAIIVDDMIDSAGRYVKLLKIFKNTERGKSTRLHHMACFQALQISEYEIHAWKSSCGKHCAITTTHGI